MRIGIISDIHGNLPALKVILDKFQIEKCDRIYCLGDTIAIGPFSKECIKLLLTLPNIKFLMGNHEEYFVKGILNVTTGSMSEGEKQHQRWIANSLNHEIRKKMSKFPYLIEESIEGVNVAFMHYALNNKENKKTFKDIEKDVTQESMNILFKEVDAEVIFYGHEHYASDVRGEKHYINVGSSGCAKDDIIHCTIVEFKEGNYDVKVYKMKYDKDKVLKGLYEKEIPEREIIAKIFFGC
ncbi:metallophosphoesterase [Clostridium sp. CS001]|uniref:metallophosphoesterase family protein n=1 Tax=Clostridium sp. CS001 TaxID=2880648 RepID=UPI001CF524B6|nr:metallophosphoesterase [Clostridium sp. CS001]MCB2291554.1 metallophosphoesterase [Clostridium sp. CS001]